MTVRRAAAASALCAALAGAGVAAAGPSSPAAARASVAVGTSTYGPMLFDGHGYALYAFTSDPRGKATCYGACAKAWPPYLVKARPAAGRGTRAALIGVARRRDGRLQATYSGRPLYYYEGDDAPGVVLCQNVREYGGLWLVVRGSGKLVR